MVVDFSEDPGVDFVEADGARIRTMDICRLAGDEAHAHDIPAFLALVPDLPGARAVCAGHTDSVQQPRARAVPAPRRRRRSGRVAVHGRLDVHRKSLPASHYCQEAIQVHNGDESALTLCLIQP